jgi:hypothetical protein
LTDKRARDDAEAAADVGNAGDNAGEEKTEAAESVVVSEETGVKRAKPTKPIATSKEATARDTLAELLQTTVAGGDYSCGGIMSSTETLPRINVLISEGEAEEDEAGFPIDFPLTPEQHARVVAASKRSGTCADS